MNNTIAKFQVLKYFLHIMPKKLQFISVKKLRVALNACT